MLFLIKKKNKYIDLLIFLGNKFKKEKKREKKEKKQEEDKKLK